MKNTIKTLRRLVQARRKDVAWLGRHKSHIPLRMKESAFRRGQISGYLRAIAEIKSELNTEVRGTALTPPCEGGTARVP